MFSFYLACVIFITITFQICDKGCLKCNSKNECIFCDISNKYYLQGINCIESTLTNCSFLNGNGECAQCEDQYYLDTSTKKCVVVENTKQIQYCASYGVGYVCIKCSKGYFINSGKCVLITKTVNNCEQYFDDGKCAACMSGYIFDAFRKNCVVSPNIRGCANYSFISCKYCDFGYIANPNLYITKYTTNNALFFSDIKPTNSSNDWVAIDSCQKLQENCLIAEKFHTCAQCYPGYYIGEDKSCHEYPKPVIEGCITYSSLFTCSECQNTYYLEAFTKCSPIPANKLITDCIAYNNTDINFPCIECTTTKFLTENMCNSARRDSLNIKNCKNTAINDDTCAVCDDGFVVTDDKKKCLYAIINCKLYSSSSLSTNILTCQTCDDTFYLNIDSDFKTTCISGSINGCKTYSSSNVCISCDTTSYYLYNDKCIKHINVNNCAIYSGINFNKCVKCVDGYYPFTYVYTCLPTLVIINHCNEYYDAFTCKSCDIGYFIKDNKCVSISETFPNCQFISGDLNSCDFCVDGYALKKINGNKSCVLNHNYILDQCDSTGSLILFKNASEIDNDSCLICKENSYPFDLSNLFACISNDLLDTKNIVNENIIPDCLKYGFENDTIVCLQCPKYLKILITGLRSCVTSCDDSTNTIIEDNLNGSYNTCAPYNYAEYALTGCARAIKIYMNEFILMCIKGGGSLKVGVNFSNLIPSEHPSIWQDIYESTVPRSENAFMYQGFETILYDSVTAVDKHDNENDQKKNCELYWYNMGIIYCVRCKWGYSVKFDSTSDKTKCLLIEDCDKNITYTGYSKNLNVVLSCHACINQKVLLVTALIHSDTTRYIFSNFANDIPIIQCVPTNPNLSTPNSPKESSNCFVYGWLKTGLNQPIKTSGCLACQPGYSLDVPFGSCSKINYCDLTKNYMVNKCSECLQIDNAGIKWRALEYYMSEKCFVVNTPNCLFAHTNINFDGTFDCKVCKPGYVLNLDSKCEALILPKCNDALGYTNFFTHPNLRSSNDIDITVYYYLKYLSKKTVISGCNICSDGFTGFKLPLNETQCIFSPYVQTNSYKTTIPIRYITDCAKYTKNLNQITNSPTRTCAVCKNGKILTQNKFICTSIIDNCIYAQNNDFSKCYTCIDTHVQINGICVVKNIKNCLNYDENDEVEQLLCVECHNGYVISEDKKFCYLGKITGCDIYLFNDPYRCLKCLPNYNLVFAYLQNYCLKNNDESNCAIIDNDYKSGLKNNLYNCKKCVTTNTKAFFRKNYDNTNKNLPQSICLALNTIDKCASYDSDSENLINNSFFCTECLAGFYLEKTENICLPRKNQPLSCLLFYIDKDKCLICKPFTFKTFDETECVDIPKGILRCASYYNDTICTSCDAPAYLSNNTCLLSVVIDHCSNYSANYSCIDCESSYFLINSTSCVLSNAKNCLTYKTINQCKACESNKGLKNEANDIINCVDKDLVNCEISTDVYPFKCMLCNIGYYLNWDGSCIPSTSINKCLYYDSKYVCNECDKSAVLSVDKKICDDISFIGKIDPNCANSQQTTKPSCSKCKPGFIFVDNECSPCNKDTQYGCFYCDPDNNSICFVCQPGYYQTSKGICIDFTNVKNDQVNNTNNSATIINTLIKTVSIYLFLSFF